MYIYDDVQYVSDLSTLHIVFLFSLPRWKFTTVTVPRQYRRRIYDTGKVLVQYRCGY